MNVNGTRLRSCGLLAIVALALSTAFPQPALAVRINLERPGDKEFVRDLAGMLSPADKTKIVQICTDLLKAKATPIIVVTIDSMAAQGGEDLRIETFARLLFDQWGIGHETLGNTTWNTGILLLVSKGDHKARIELGAGWGREQDQLCRQIMDEYIVPKFKEGNFSGGIVLGVESLAKMAQGLRLPTRPRPWWHYAMVLGAVGLGVFTAISLIRRGSSGWAWLIWGAVFAVIGVVLYQLLSSSSRGGGGFSGGSFGGGSSGGGGATGSW
jgi:uncharacterized protein